MKFAPSAWLSSLLAWIRLLGPYAAIALALPGGSLTAIFLWLSWHRPAGGLTHSSKPHA